MTKLLGNQCIISEKFSSSNIYTEIKGGSDHKLLKFTRYTRSLTRNVKYVRKRCFKNFESDKFLDKVREISWFSLYMCQNPSQAVELLTKNLTNILDSMAPIRTIQVRAKYAAWLTEETKALLKKRDTREFYKHNSKDIF